MSTESTAPRMASSSPRCPKHLDPIARREWRRIVPELERVGVIARIDGAALEAYCVAYSKMVGAQKDMSEGLTYLTGTGYIRPKPAVAIFFTAAAAVRAFAAEFGLTPMSRARIRVPDQGVIEDEMDLLLSSRGC